MGVRLENGYLRLAQWSGALIRLHWTFPLLALWFVGFSLVGVLAFFLLILAHELGHAVLVKLLGHRVVSVDVSGLGGFCRWRGPSNGGDEALIAWGGVWAQGLLYLTARMFLDLFGTPTSAPLAELSHVLTRTNVWMIVLNLIPLSPLDGASAWRLFPLLFGAIREARATRASRLLAHLGRGSAGPAVRPTDPAVPAFSAPEQTAGSTGPSGSDERFHKILADIYKNGVPKELDEEDENRQS